MSYVSLRKAYKTRFVFYLFCYASISTVAEDKDKNTCYPWERPPPSGQPESVTDASQVGKCHECLKVLQQGALQTQKTDKWAHNFIDLKGQIR